MAITDLTNTTWVLNDTIDISSFDDSGTSKPFNFTSNGNSYIRMSTDLKPNGLHYLTGDFQGDSAYVSSTNSWTDSAYKIITITGGTDVTNTALIEWLQANATQIIEGYAITYHADGGTPEPENLTGQTTLPSPLPTMSKPNFTFDGWYLDSTLTTPAVAGAEISADTDLYAKFTRSHITLDLSTIGLSEGTHSIQMKLSDDGVTKADSALSNAVSYTQYQQLTAPVISLSGNILTWSAVPNASSYKLYADNTDKGTVTSGIDLTTLQLAVGTHSIQVMAVGSGYYTDSELSAAVTYSIYTIVGTATNCTINGQASYSGTITQGGSITLTLGADGANYKLPTSVTVTGATSNFTRTSDTAGLLVISNATSDVTFSIVGEQAGITDLTGYIWRPNTTITPPPEPENIYGNTTAFASLTATSSKGSFSVPGNSYGYTFGWDSTNKRYNWLMFTDSTGQKNTIVYYWNYQSKTGWYGSINSGAESKVTDVSITFNENATMGGGFITFDTFVSWLKANGTLTKS